MLKNRKKITSSAQFSYWTHTIWLMADTLMIIILWFQYYYYYKHIYEDVRYVSYECWRKRKQITEITTWHTIMYHMPYEIHSAINVCLYIYTSDIIIIYRSFVQDEIKLWMAHMRKHTLMRVNHWIHCVFRNRNHNSNFSLDEDIIFAADITSS